MWDIGSGANIAPVVVNTATRTPTPTETLEPTATLTPTKTLTPTVTPNIAATQQYEDFMAAVKQAYEAGQISTLDGTYSHLGDYSDAYASTYGYRWEPTDVTARNFIVRADFDWEVANQKNYSGCGFKFRQELVGSPGTTTKAEYYYIAALDGVNGVLLMYKVTFEHKPASLIKKMDMPDIGENPYHAQFMLVVNDTSAYTYVNGEFLTEHKLQSNWITEEGPLEYLVLTGSDNDYGTRCKISNADVWVID